MLITEQKTQCLDALFGINAFQIPVFVVFGFLCFSSVVLLDGRVSHSSMFRPSQWSPWWREERRCSRC